MSVLKTTLLLAAGSLVAGAGALALTAAPAAAETDRTETYDLTDFTEIDVAGVFEIDITVGEAFAIELSGPEKEMALVSVSVEDGALVLDQSDRSRGKKRGGNREGVNAVISLPALEAINVSGVAEIDADGIEADGFSARLSGVGEVTLAGTCATMDVKVSGVGELNARKLECASVDVAVTGIGEATVYASQSVKAKVSGMGEISVYGKPADVSKSGGFFSEITIK